MGIYKLTKEASLITVERRAERNATERIKEGGKTAYRVVCMMLAVGSFRLSLHAHLI